LTWLTSLRNLTKKFRNGISICAEWFFIATRNEAGLEVGIFDVAQVAIKTLEEKDDKVADATTITTTTAGRITTSGKEATTILKEATTILVVSKISSNIRT
jgi:hypothetical protein